MKIVIYILFLFAAFQAKSQINLSYSMMSLGAMPKISSYSNPVTFSGENCFKVSNTLSKFWSSNTGVFFANCFVNSDFIKFSIKINPNPVTTYALIKFINKLQIDNKIKVNVYSNSGQLMSTFETTQDQMLNGYKLDMQSLASGYYFIQISSTSILQAFKILKN